jgi:hypothetical protein
MSETTIQISVSNNRGGLTVEGDLSLLRDLLSAMQGHQHNRETRQIAEGDLRTPIDGFQPARLVGAQAEGRP